ncbi:Variable outer membrane protein [Borrelia duttonii CR2A]|uniref:Variable outer membrane protein n=1 Tax=Borrelia duttonii CR2A TaxID=1432657 RepID=W6TF86_9SPIR|nr:Variable outer membrane protein [Borrelia duttonii CR2A]
MMLVVMMGCNSGVVEAEQGKNKFLQSLVNVSEEFLNVFTSFGEYIIWGNGRECIGVEC